MAHRRSRLCRSARREVRSAYRELIDTPLGSRSEINEVELSHKLCTLTQAQAEATLAGITMCPVPDIAWRYDLHSCSFSHFDIALDDLLATIHDLVAVQHQAQGGMQERGQVPIVVCLCGSTRFHEAFRTAALEETLAGRIVLSIGDVWHSDEALGLTEEDQADLDELHLHKIDLADEILVLNVGGYVGQSTANEIRYARAQGKRIRWLEPVQEGGVSYVA